MKFYSILFLGLLLGAFAPVLAQVPSLNLLKYELNTSISSGSGMELAYGKLWIAGDDAPTLYGLNPDTWAIEERIALVKADSMVGNRMWYKTKPDFEAVAVFEDAGQKKLLVVSSGTHSPARDTCLVVNLNEKRVEARISLRALYDALRDRIGLKADGRINIEGLAIDDAYVYLGHRGNVVPRNVVYRVARAEFFAYLASNAKSAVPAFTHHEITLVSDKGYRVGLSGLCVLPGQGLLLTASIELNLNDDSDGEIKGSYVGVLRSNANGFDEPAAVQVLEGGQPRITKLESICVLEQTAGKLRVAAVSDNDNGTSELLLMELIGF